MTIKITGAKKLQLSLGKLNKNLKQLPQEAYDVFYQNTPVRTGNARRNTNLVNNTIKAEYPYAKRLDMGWSSQRPNGMTLPTLKFITKRVKQLLKQVKAK